MRTRSGLYVSHYMPCPAIRLVLLVIPLRDRPRAGDRNDSNREKVADPLNHAFTPPIGRMCALIATTTAQYRVLTRPDKKMFSGRRFSGKGPVHNRTRTPDAANGTLLGIAAVDMVFAYMNTTIMAVRALQAQSSLPYFTRSRATPQSMHVWIWQVRFCVRSETTAFSAGRMPADCAAAAERLDTKPL